MTATRPVPAEVYVRRRIGVGVALALLIAGVWFLVGRGGDGDTGSVSGGTTSLASLDPLDSVAESEGGSATVTDASVPVENTTATSSASTITSSSAGGTTSPPATVTVAPSTVPPPTVDAAAYAVYDLTAGSWLAELDGESARPVGSLMKLLTARVVIDAGEPTKVVTVPQLTLDPAESAVGLYAGEQLERQVLLRAMLIVSANDAARVLALDVAGSQEAFVAQMNATAQRLGLTATTAANSTGLDADGARSSARDMVTLGAQLMQDDDFRTTVARRDARLHGQTFPASNDLLSAYIGADGIKTGTTTQAGFCLLGSATRDGRSIIVAVLGSSSDAARLAATTALLDWAYGNT